MYPMLLLHLAVCGVARVPTLDTVPVHVIVTILARESGWVWVGHALTFDKTSVIYAGGWLMLTFCVQSRYL